MPKFLLLSFFLFLTLNTYAQQTSIDGYITDKNTNEVLIGANVYLPVTKTGTITNEYGYYSINLSSNDTLIQFSYLGYNTESIKNIRLDKQIDIALTPASLSEIVVTEKRLTKEISINKINAPVKLLQSIPTIGGENDIMKSLALFPGVSIGQEGTSGLYIRGGTPDQNLILLDGIPVYNANHLGGFFSVFNSEAINNVEVYKGDFPARYGGRASSVIDINMREGNKEEFRGNVSLGFLTSGLLLEGPIKKDTASYLLSARLSYLSLFNAFRSKSDDFFNYWLYDINFKTNYNLKKGKLFLSAYTGTDTGLNRSEGYSSIRGSGDDIVRSGAFKNRNNVDWGNTIVSGRYVLPISKKLFGKFLVGYSNYRYKLFAEDESSEIFMEDTIQIKSDFLNSATVRDYLLTMNFDYQVNNNYLIKYGAGGTLHNFTTQTFSKSQDVEEAFSYPSQEYFVYLENEFKTKKFITNIGLRYSAIATKRKTYQNPEPRLSTTYLFNDNFKINASFTNANQYIHLLTVNNGGIPNDVWIPVTDSIPPQQAQQMTLGIDYTLKNKINILLAAYYKRMNNLLDFQVSREEEFVNLAKFEQQIELGGKGEAYGIEATINKNVGRLNGFLSYTLSWNNRQFANINEGKTYPFTYDRRHDLAAVLQYKLSEKWSLNGNFVYQSGSAVTLPVALLPRPDGTPRAVFAGRNNGRMPAYHRADLGFQNVKKSKKGNDLIWIFTVYNLYNRQNATSLRIKSRAILDNQDQFLYNAYDVEKISLFSFIPAVTFKYKF